MEKTILISVSPYVHKYYFNEEYTDLPEGIKEELRAKLGVIAEKVNCIISLGFTAEGELFIEERHEDPMQYDDIGAGLEMKKLQLEEKELFKALKMWYMIYRTSYGEIVRELVALQAQGKSQEKIIEVIGIKHGKEGKSFAEQLLSE